MRIERWLGMLVIVACIGSPTLAGTILFIGDRDGDANGDGTNAAFVAADNAMIARLGLLGFTVIDRDDEGSTSPGGNGASGADLGLADCVIVSSTVSSGTHINNDQGASVAAILASGKPVILMETGNSDEYGMSAGAVGGVATMTSIMLNDLASYPALTAGLGGPGAINIYNSPQAIGAFGAIGFAPLAPIGTVLATNDSVNWPGFPAGFALNVLGVRQNGASTIIALPFNNGAFTDASPTGLQLFDNAVNFAAHVPEPSSLVLASFAICMAGVCALRRSRR